MGPGVRGNPDYRSDPRRGDRREPIRAAGRELRRGAEEWVDGPLAAMPGDQRRGAEDLEGPPPSGASRVGGKAREEAGKANDPLRSATWSEHRRAIYGSVPKPASGELHGSGAV